MTETTQQLVWRRFNMQGGTIYRAQEWTTEPSPDMNGNKYTIFVLTEEITCFQNDRKLGAFSDLDQAMRAAEADLEAVMVAHV